MAPYNGLLPTTSYEFYRSRVGTRFIGSADCGTLQERSHQGGSLRWFGIFNKIVQRKSEVGSRFIGSADCGILQKRSHQGGSLRWCGIFNKIVQHKSEVGSRFIGSADCGILQKRSHQASLCVSTPIRSHQPLRFALRLM